MVRVIWSITQAEEGLIKPYKIWKNAFNIIFTNETTVIKRQQSSAVPYQLTRCILQHKHSPLKSHINGKILETKLDEKTWAISKSGRQINRLCCIHMRAVAFYKPFGLPYAWTFLLKPGAKFSVTRSVTDGLGIILIGLTHKVFILLGNPFFCCFTMGHYLSVFYHHWYSLIVFASFLSWFPCLRLTEFFFSVFQVPERTKVCRTSYISTSIKIYSKIPRGTAGLRVCKKKKKKTHLQQVRIVSRIII